jgi:hypothetical protein
MTASSKMPPELLWQVEKGCPEPRGGVQGPQKMAPVRFGTPFGFRCSSTFTNFFKIDGVRTRPDAGNLAYIDVRESEGQGQLSLELKSCGMHCSEKSSLMTEIGQRKGSERAQVFRFTPVTDIRHRTGMTVEGPGADGAPSAQTFGTCTSASFRPTEFEQSSEQMEPLSLSSSTCLICATALDGSTIASMSAAMERPAKVAAASGVVPKCQPTWALMPIASLAMARAKCERRSKSALFWRHMDRCQQQAEIGLKSEV